MRAKWTGLSKGTRLLLIVVGAYLVQVIVVLATAHDRNNGYASILIGAFSSAFGAGLAAAGLQTEYLRSLRLRWHLRRGAQAAQTAQATVAAVVSFRNSEFNYPVFEYATPDGVTHRHSDASSRALTVGATTEVRYLPAESDFAVGPLGRFNAVAFGFLALLGAVFLVMMPLMTLQAILS